MVERILIFWVTFSIQETGMYCSLTDWCLSKIAMVLVRSTKVIESKRDLL